MTDLDRQILRLWDEGHDTVAITYLINDALPPSTGTFPQWFSSEPYRESTVHRAPDPRQASAESPTVKQWSE